MYGQAVTLVAKLYAEPQISLEESWKLITIFVGGNDMCQSCIPEFEADYSPDKYYENVKNAVEYLYYQVSSISSPRKMIDCHIWQDFSNKMRYIIWNSAT